jgi:hypothetical protein
MDSKSKASGPAFLVASLRLDGGQSEKGPDQPDERPLRLTIDQFVSDAKSVAKTSKKRRTFPSEKGSFQPVHPTKGPERPPE